MKLILCSILLGATLLLNSSLMGQKLRVLDKTNLRAIENVVIENKNGISLKTNSNGVVDLTTFNKTEELWLARRWQIGRAHV